MSWPPVGFYHLLQRWPEEEGEREIAAPFRPGAFPQTPGAKPEFKKKIFKSALIIQIVYVFLRG